MKNTGIINSLLQREVEGARDGTLHRMFKLGHRAAMNQRKSEGFEYSVKVTFGVGFNICIEVNQHDNPRSIISQTPISSTT